MTMKKTLPLLLLILVLSAMMFVACDLKIPSLGGKDTSDKQTSDQNTPNQTNPSQNGSDNLGDPNCEHTFEITSSTATCTSAGTVTKKCSKCDAENTEDVEKLEHDLKQTSVVKATCTKEGYTLMKCQNDGCTYSTQTNKKPKTSHSFKAAEYSVYPTCKTSGTSVQKCKNCTYEKKTTVPYSQIFKSAYTTGTKILARGIDISSYQPNLTLSDFQTIKSKYDYIILRAGSTNIGEETSTNVFTGEDDWFDKYYDLAKQVGLDVGTYYYVNDPLVNGSYTNSITLDHIKKEAEKFVKIIEGKTFEYPVYFDLEDSTFEQYNSATLTEYCFTFCDITQKAGFYSGVYLGKYWLSDRVDSDKLGKNFDLWIPVYPGESCDGSNWNTYFGNGSGWSVTVNGVNKNLHDTPCGMWQYSIYTYINSKLDGIDTNVCYIDYPTIIKNLHLSGY